MLWFVYPAAGMVFGEMLKKTGNMDLFYKKTLAVSITMLAAMVSIMFRTGYDIRSLYALADDLYYQQDYYHFLFTLPAVMIAFALCHLLLSGLEQTKLGRFITYSSVNLNAIYVIQWLLVTYTHAFLMLTGIETISVEAVIPIGLLITASSIGICVIWKRVRNLYFLVNCV